MSISINTNHGNSRHDTHHGRTTTPRRRAARLVAVAGGIAASLIAIAPMAMADTPPAPSPGIGPAEIAGLSDSGYKIFSPSVATKISSTTITWLTNAPSTDVTISTAKPKKSYGRWSFGGDAAVVGGNVTGAGHPAYVAKHLLPGQTYWYVLSAPTNVTQAPVEKMGSFTVPTPKGPGEVSMDTDSGFTISNVSTTPKGTWAKVSWNTNAATTQIVYSTTKPTLKNGKYSIGGTETVAGATVNGSGARSYEMMNLAPGTKYWFVLTAPTGSGFTQVQQIGSFTTLRRKVEVRFQSIHMIDDADGILKGAGDTTFYFRYVGAPTSNGYHKPMHSGDTHTIDYKGNGAYTAVRFDAPTKVSLAVQGAEDDQGITDWCPYGEGGGWDGEFVQYSNDCFDFSFAEGTYTVPSGKGETTSFDFTIQVYRSPALRFTVSGVVIVTYV